MFLCVTSAIAVYDCFTDRASRKLLFLGCVFFLTWTSGRYFGEYSNTAESLVDWNTQMDHVNDTDNLYMVTDDFAYYSYRTIIAQDVTFSASEGVALSDVSRDGTEASFTYEKTGTAAEAYVVIPITMLSIRMGTSLPLTLRSFSACASCFRKAPQELSRSPLRSLSCGGWATPSLSSRSADLSPLASCPGRKEKRADYGYQLRAL